MATRRKRMSRKNKSRKMYGGKTGKKWVTAIDAATKTLSETKSISKAKKSLRKQALVNARKLFGSIGI
jgi:hypothetical protein